MKFEDVQKAFVLAMKSQPVQPSYLIPHWLTKHYIQLVNAKELNEIRRPKTTSRKPKKDKPKAARAIKKRAR